ncbi:MAG: tRNA(adenine34) deaminase [Thiomicrorhabdus sp.]|nr:MAG: tRNA(adenine34) deaminase [Thiomicrorhabdus sp.]
MDENKITAPENLSRSELDEFWMRHAYALAEEARLQGEIPVGAIVVLDNQLIGEGWNQSIQNSDPTAHAEMIALKQAGELIGNYRLIDTTLYVTLEPCPMCAGAMVHARVAEVVYGATDLKTGAAGSVFNLVNNPNLNHQLKVHSGVLEDECSSKLSTFFRARRKAHKEKKLLQKKNSY